MTETTNTIRLIFDWETLQPDYRQYKPANPLIRANLKIGLDVPLETQYIINATQIITAQLSNQKEDEPILTPLGMRYCIDKFEAVMSNGEKSTDSKTATDDGDWADVEEENPDGTTAKSDDNVPWEGDEPEETKTDGNFDEDWE